MQIRPAIYDDIPTIMKVAHAAWQATYPGIISQAQISYMLEQMYAADVLEKHLREDTQSLLLAVEHNDILGFAGYAPEEAGVYKIHKLYIDPKHQGKGAGRALVHAVTEKTQAQMLRLNVNRANPARFFYERLGFSIIDEEDIPFGPFWLNDYVMQKSLHNATKSA